MAPHAQQVRMGRGDREKGIRRLIAAGPSGALPPHSPCFTTQMPRDATCVYFFPYDFKRKNVACECHKEEMIVDDDDEQEKGLFVVEISSGDRLFRV